MEIDELIISQRNSRKPTIDCEEEAGQKKTLGSRRSLAPGRAENSWLANKMFMRGRTLSTAASDTERERVFFCPASSSQSSTACKEFRGRFENDLRIEINYEKTNKKTNKKSNGIRNNLRRPLRPPCICGVRGRYRGGGGGTTAHSADRLH